MEHVTVEGQWWLPAEPDHRIPGTLVFDAAGLQLALHGGAFRDGGQESRVEPVVHGGTHDGSDCTLFDVVQTASTERSGKAESARYRSEIALRGCHAGADECTAVRCSFDCLDAWAGPPAITEIRGGDRVEVSRAVAELGGAEAHGASVKLLSRAVGSIRDERVDVTRSTYFVIETPGPRPAMALIDEYVHPLQDLLALCLGRAVRLTRLGLLASDLDDPPEGPADAFFSAIQAPALAVAPTSAEIRSTTSPTILPNNQDRTALHQLIERWFALWPRYRRVASLVLAPLNVSFMYTEDRYATTFQSAEALHDLTHLNGGVPKRCKALPYKINHLIEQTGPVGEAVLLIDKDIGKAAFKIRNLVSHGQVAKQFVPEEAVAYCEILRWVVRVRLLMDVVDDGSGLLRHVAAHPSFRYALMQVEEVRAGKA